MARRSRATGVAISVEEMEVWARTGYRPSRSDDGMPPELRERWEREAQEAAAATPAEDEESRRHGDRLVRSYFDGQAAAREPRRANSGKGGKRTQLQYAERQMYIKGYVRGIAHLETEAVIERVRARFGLAPDDPRRHNAREELPQGRPPGARAAKAERIASSSVIPVAAKRLGTRMEVAVPRDAPAARRALHPRKSRASPSTVRQPDHRSR